MRRIAAGLLLIAGCSKPQSQTPDTSASTPTDTAAVVQGGVTAGNTTDTKADISSDTKTVANPPKGDAIVGMVGEHGADPITFIAITPAGGPQTRVSGGQLEQLRAVKGAEVWASGRKDASGFRVDTFVVRRANNQDVADGIVSVSGTTVIVRTASGTVRYPDAPTALRAAAGARVWITPPVAGQAPSFGVIRPASKQ
jgi:hypothetical protein